MIFPALTSVFYFATEMRCYGILLGLTGIALVCWQHAAEKRWRRASIAGLFLSLTGALCCHYYAVLLWVPFGLAELTRAKIARRIDKPVWAALLCSPLILVVFLPAIRAAKAAYGANFLVEAISRFHCGNLSRIPHTQFCANPCVSHRMDVSGSPSGQAF